MCANNSGIKFPQKFASGSIEGEYFLRGADSVENSVYDYGTSLQAAFFLGIETPRHRQVLDIAWIDLREGRVVVIFRCAAIDGPIVVFSTDLR